MLQMTKNMLKSVWSVLTLICDSVIEGRQKQIEYYSKHHRPFR